MAEFVPRSVGVQVSRGDYIRRVVDVDARPTRPTDAAGLAPRGLQPCRLPTCRSGRLSSRRSAPSSWGAQQGPATGPCPPRLHRSPLSQSVDASISPLRPGPIAAGQAQTFLRLHLSMPRERNHEPVDAPRQPEYITRNCRLQGHSLLRWRSVLYGGAVRRCQRQKEMLKPKEVA
jgi:hypothetical protein